MQVYSDLTPKPYEVSGGDESEALTGVVSEYFPKLKVWILEIVKANRVCIYTMPACSATIYSLSLFLFESPTLNGSWRAILCREKIPIFIIYVVQKT